MLDSLPDVIIHTVFSTGEQRPCLAKPVRGDLNRCIATALKLCDSPALLIRSLDDHVHILSALDLDWSVDDVVNEVKKRSAHWLSNCVDGFEDFRWQLGYASFSVGKTNAREIYEYIACQEDLHLRESFKEEYRRLLDEHGLEYDETEMWE